VDLMMVKGLHKPAYFVNILISEGNHYKER